MKPYQIVKNRRVTEKSRVLEALHENDSNPSIRKCKNAKYVFVVDKKANKHQIKQAVESLYEKKKIKVISVNTILNKPKKRRVRGRSGKTAYLKKAIVTLDEGDFLDEQV